MCHILETSEQDFISFHHGSTLHIWSPDFKVNTISIFFLAFCEDLKRNTFCSNVGDGTEAASAKLEIVLRLHYHYQRQQKVGIQNLTLSKPFILNDFGRS
jgi:hypothetical protein